MKANPEQNELVLITVKKIFPYGAFCGLDEYDGLEAFVHISEVAPRWIKNIREFLKEGQRTVAMVYRLSPEKNMIDLSLKRVSEADKRWKMESLRRDKRGTKLFEIALKKMGKTPAEAMEEAGKELAKEFGDVYTALEEFAANPESAERVKLDKKWIEVLLEVSSQNIKKPKAEVSGKMEISCVKLDGIEIIKGALGKVAEKNAGTTEVKLHYLGAPYYQLSVVAVDYKSAEKTLKEITENVKHTIEKSGGSFEFKRDE
ncbi:MAG: translation initiation factor IF-2 subunit alpha [Candidatus Micrarchaeota archaeon]